MKCTKLWACRVRQGLFMKQARKYYNHMHNNRFSAWLTSLWNNHIYIKHAVVPIWRQCPLMSSIALNAGLLIAASKCPSLLVALVTRRCAHEPHMERVFFLFIFFMAEVGGCSCILQPGPLSAHPAEGAMASLHLTCNARHFHHVRLDSGRGGRIHSTRWRQSMNSSNRAHCKPHR